MVVKNKEDIAVSYIVYESALTRMERTIKRLWILCMILVAVIIGSNIAWIYHESQFEDVSVTQDVVAEDNVGDVNVTGTGDITWQSELDRP